MKKELNTAFSTRQYMLSKDFEIYYYSDRTLKNVKRHSHDYYEFYFFLEGDVTMSIRTADYHLRRGDVIVIPPGLSHCAAIRDTSIPYRRIVFWISRDYLRQLGLLSADYLYLPQKAEQTGRYVYPFPEFSFHAVQTKAFAFLEEIHSDRFGREARVSLCIGDLLLHLGRGVYEQEHAPEGVQQDSLYANILRYIEGNIDGDLSLDTLADRFYSSKYHIAHVFKEHTGYSVHQYITKKRLAMCADAIRNGMAITQACEACGFPDYTCFYRAFRKEYGVSPRKYRAAQAGSHPEHGR